MSIDSNFLEISNLCVSFFTYKSVVRAIQGLNLSMQRGETLGVVGESGCGKSVMALSILRLIPSPFGKIETGEIWFEGDNLLQKTESQMRKLRGKTISMIFQDPMTSLNPVFTVGDQIVMVVRTHQGVDKTTAVDRAVEMLSLVELPDPADILKKYPHELSGGMRQRIMIAMALICRPRLLIADEPTTALDVTIQAQVLHLIRDLKKEIQTSIMLITHDLGVVAKTCEKIVVMYAGINVEHGDLRHILKNPKHPYTMGLLASTPKIGESKERLYNIDGSVPDLANRPAGCPFHPRCKHVMDRCQKDFPEAIEVEEGHIVHCHLYTTGS